MAFPMDVCQAIKNPCGRGAVACHDESCQENRLMRLGSHDWGQPLRGEARMVAQNQRLAKGFSKCSLRWMKSEQPGRPLGDLEADLGTSIFAEIAKSQSDATPSQPAKDVQELEAQEIARNLTDKISTSPNSSLLPAFSVLDLSL